VEPEGISPREIIRVVPRINDSSLEPEGSGDFFVFVFLHSPVGRVALPPPTRSDDHPAKPEEPTTITAIARTKNIWIVQIFGASAGAVPPALQ
jgi:hypothetical protein